MKTKIIFFLAVVFIVSNTVVSQQVSVLSDPLFNGPEGIIYDEENNQYIVGNANDGKLLIIDNFNNVSIFKENIGANVIMAFEIIGDSLLISTNEPRTLTCIDKNTGEPIYQLFIDTISNACSQMAYDDRTGFLYIVDQYGAILKADVKNASCNIFTTSLSQGTQAIEIDTVENRLIIFSWPTSIIKYVNINDSTDITNGPATGITKCTSSTLDNNGYIYVSSWSGHKVMKMHIDSLDNAENFCNDSLFQPVGITYNPVDEKFAVCNFGNNTITFIQSETLATINSFSHLGDFHTINYSGDYEEILDYLDNLYVGGKNQLFDDFGCSLYLGTGDPENIFFGRNFDNPQQDVLVGKYSSPGCYESIALNRLADLGLPVGTNFNNLTPSQSLLLLRAPYFAADGLNSMGVACGLAYVEEVDVEIDTTKQNIFITRWVREILDHAANVEEAIEITNSYNIIDNMFGNNTLCHHLLVSDGTGATAILEYHDGQFKVIDPEVNWQILTNTPIYNVPLHQLFSQCYRYELLYLALEDQNGEILDWRNGLDILELPTWGNISNGTQWSNLFDLNENMMYLSLYRDFDNIVQVNVENFEFRNYGDFTIYEQLEIDENGNNINEPGESVEIILSLIVDFISTGVSGTISCSNSDIVINTPSSDFGNINPDEIISNFDDPFEIEISEDAVSQDVVLNLSLTTDYNYVFETDIMIAINDITSIDDNINNTENKLFMLKNYPNPFNSNTTISFQTKNEPNQENKVKIYDLNGQRIKVIPLNLQQAENSTGAGNNNYSIIWDGTNEDGNHVSSGIYFYNLNINNKSVATEQMILIK
ncbi:MAG: linear amide C-N hydrolase [Bacteroidales bacterium]|nr:linear amide C-N hydrolase [Bacteroidales bacterium]